MTIKIRTATADDLDRLMEIFDAARRFMAQSGNPGQWADGYPSLEVVSGDIARGCCHVCTDLSGRVVATFSLIEGEEPAYRNISDGAWLDDEPYCTIHRLASDGSVKGIGQVCMEWCIAHSHSLRIDTHAANLPMLHLACRNGFVHCGTIFYDNGKAVRKAYQLKSAKK